MPSQTPPPLSACAAPIRMPKHTKRSACSNKVTNPKLRCRRVLPLRILEKFISETSCFSRCVPPSHNRDDRTIRSTRALRVVRPRSSREVAASSSRCSVVGALRQLFASLAIRRAEPCAERSHVAVSLHTPMPCCALLTCALWAARAPPPTCYRRDAVRSWCYGRDA